MNDHWLPYDYCRCAAETCPVKEKCLRFLTREKTGPRTPFLVWGYDPIEPCDMYLNTEDQR